MKLDQKEDRISFLLSSGDKVTLSLVLDEKKFGTQGAVSCRIIEGLVPENKSLGAWLGNDPKDFGGVVSWVAATQNRFQRKLLPEEIVKMEIPLELGLAAIEFSLECDLLDEMLDSSAEPDYDEDYYDQNW